MPFRSQAVMSTACVREVWVSLAKMKSADRLPIKIPRSKRSDPMGFADPRMRPVRHLSSALDTICRRERCRSVSSRNLRCRCRRRHVDLLAREKRPGDPRRLVGQRHRDDLRALALQHLPRPSAGCFRLARVAQHGRRADDPFSADRGVICALKEGSSTGAEPKTTFDDPPQRAIAARSSSLIINHHRNRQRAARFPKAWDPRSQKRRRRESRW